MPQVGQDIETAVLLTWHKQVNDVIHRGDVIATVESDKASFDVEAFDAGVLLTQLYEEGQEVKVLTPIAYLGEAGETIPQAQALTRTDTSASVPNTLLASTPGDWPRHRVRVIASPSAKRLAKEKGVDLATLEGTGPQGRITKRDVLAALSAAPGRRQDTGDQVIPFSPRRAKIAERLTHSKQTIPHFMLSADICMSAALTWRRRFNAAQGHRITVTDMIIKATALALKKHPRMNAHVEPDRVVLKRHIHIGVAVSMPDGLAVPVIADAERKSLIQISTESRHHTEAMRAGKLLDNTMGSFTISNLGMFGIDRFQPIINPPECAILALGTCSPRPAVVHGGLCIRDLMTATLACDHRAVDGAVAARFLEDLKQTLEDPNLFTDP
jgi:pyruvate dehydrogenase E2 component (dihydrolipoamide acetyltransferase)